MDINELSLYFVEEITQKDKTVISFMKRVEMANLSIERLLKQGWTIDLIKNELDEFKRLYPAFCPNIYHIEEIMANKTPPNNLLDHDVFYYHQELREIPKPSKIVLNKETLEYEREESAFFLEMKAVYTLDDLLKYWYKQICHTATQHDIRRDTGRAEYLLKNYDIDEILFMIDLTKEGYMNRKAKLNNLFKIEDFADKVESTIMSKKSIHMIHGINKVRTRKQAVLA